MKEDNASCCSNCGVGGCCHNGYHGGKYVLLRWLLGLLILAAAFGIGVKIGEFKEGFMGGKHYRMMQRWDESGRPTMMFQQRLGEESITLPKSTTTKPSPTTIK